MFFSGEELGLIANITNLFPVVFHTEGKGQTVIVLEGQRKSDTSSHRKQVIDNMAHKFKGAQRIKQSILKSLHIAGGTGFFQIGNIIFPVIDQIMERINPAMVYHFPFLFNNKIAEAYDIALCKPVALV